MHDNVYQFSQIKQHHTQKRLDCVTAQFHFLLVFFISYSSNLYKYLNQQRPFFIFQKKNHAFKSHEILFRFRQKKTKFIHPRFNRTRINWMKLFIPFKKKIMPHADERVQMVFLWLIEVKKKTNEGSYG